MLKADTTREDEVKTPETEAPADPKEDKKDAKVGDIIKEEKETVGLDKFLELKKQNKELKLAMTTLEKRLEKLAEKGDEPDSDDIKDTVDSIIEDYPDVDPSFIKKFGKAIEKKLEAEFDKKLDEKIRPITEKDKADKIDTVFNKHFKKAIENMPEYEGIVNPDVIKALSLDPRNSDKTFPQLIEETYGKAIVGKRTMEPTKPRGGKEPGTIDFARAKTDSTYFKEIMSDPQLKKEYNEGLVKRVF